MLHGPCPIKALAEIHQEESAFFYNLDRFQKGLPSRPKTIVSGVYRIQDPFGHIIYIGQSSDICKRMSQYVDHWFHKIWGHDASVVSYEIIIYKDDRLKREKELIELYQPICNIQHNPQKKVPLMSPIEVPRPNPLARGLLAAGPTAPNPSTIGNPACLGNLTPGPSISPLKKALMEKPDPIGLMRKLSSY